MEQEILENYVAKGLSRRQIAIEVGCAPNTITYWLNKYGLSTRRKNDNLSLRNGADSIERVCSVHGLTIFKPANKRKQWRCRKCNTEKVDLWRKKKKQEVVNEFGGGCQICGYNKYLGALEFHHLDPSKKLFNLSHQNWSRRKEVLEEELKKCILLCANCHREVEAGLLTTG